MTRTQQTHEAASSSPATDPLAAPVEDVLPEHVLMRLLHEHYVVAGDTEPDTEFALQLASMIAASQSLSEPIQESAAIEGSQSPPDDDGSEEDADECFDLTDLVNELEISSDIDANSEQAERSQEETLSHHVDANAADDAVPEEPVSEVVQPERDAVAIDDSTADDVSEPAIEPADEPALGAIVGETGLQSDDVSSEPHATETVDKRAIPAGAANGDRHFEEAEIGALMAELGGSRTEAGADEEQQGLKDVFGDPDEASAQITPTIEEEPPTEPEAVEILDDTSGDADPTTKDEDVVEPVANAAPEVVRDPTPDAQPETVLDDAADAEPEAVLDDAKPEAVVDVVAGAETDPLRGDAPAEEAMRVEAPHDVATENALDLASEPATETPPDAATEAAASPVAEPAEELAAEPTAEIPAASAPTEASTATDEEFALTNNSVDKVQDFLGDLKSALVEMAHRPQQAVDVEPLVEALQAGFERSAEQAAQTSTAVASLSEHMTQFGRNIEGGVAKSIDTIQRTQVTKQAPSISSEPSFVGGQSKSQAVVLGAISLVVLGWSILFWIKTGSPRLALGTLIGANAIACCLLLSRRDRS